MHQGSLSHQGFLEWQEMHSSECTSQASAAVEQASFTQPQESVVEESGSKLREINDMHELSGTEQLNGDHEDAAENKENVPDSNSEEKGVSCEDKNYYYS